MGELDSSLPWAVPPAMIRNLKDGQLKNLMRELLLAEAYADGADVSRVLVNTEDKAADGGCDASSPPGLKSRWLSPQETCWQFKAGVAGQPEKLKGEVRKPIPAKTLKAGGRFVLVASAATSGRASIDTRRSILQTDATKGRIPNSQIEVLTSESLANWVNEFPAVAARVRTMPDGFKTLSEWKNDPRHQEAWVSTPATNAKLDQVRRDLDPRSTGVTHLHVYGSPGVGKTRLVLEACRGAGWARSVIYLPEADLTLVNNLLTAAARAAQTQMVLVVDEVLKDTVRRLPALPADAHVRIISIGHEGSPDGGAIPELAVEELDDPTVERIVQTWHPGMPPEHVEYVARLSGGFLRLARLISHAVATTPAANTAELLRRSDVRQLMDRMLGNETERHALHVLAVLPTVGWTGEREAEGEAIAKHFEIPWVKVQTTIQSFHNRLGIAPAAGDLRYISPKPLGVYLTLDAWETYPEKIRTLPNVLNEEGKLAFIERLRAVVASPNAKSFAEEELQRFFRWDHWANALDAARWSALSGASPSGAARSARKALEQATVEQRREISGRARRELVRGLVDLSWHAESFHDAEFALFLLAMAENETWANNATGEFTDRFQLHLGGTAVPYVDRLAVIDDVMKVDDPAAAGLVIGALMKIGDQYGSRTSPPPPTGAPQSKEWHPATWGEIYSSVRAALERLEALSARPGVEEQLQKAVGRTAMLLRGRQVRDAAASFVRATVKNYPFLREGVRREVHRIADSERRYWKELPAEDVAWIDALHGELEDRSPAGQFRQRLGEPDLDRREEALMPLARQTVEDPATMWAEWSWLTSGQLGTGWDFGVALGALDSSGALLPQMIDAAPRGPDLRVICGYVFERARAEGHAWIDNWLDEIEQSHPDDTQLLFEVTWRCAPTARGVGRLTRLATQGRLTDIMVGQLVYGSWVSSTTIDAFKALAEALVVTPSFRPHVLGMVEHRLEKEPAAISELRDLARVLATDIDVIRSGQMTGYYWTLLAGRIVETEAAALSAAIFAAHASREKFPWFVQHSEAAGVLQTAAKADPQSVWERLKPYLSDHSHAASFAVGFSPGLLDDLPHDAILDWVGEAPEWRGSLVGEMEAKNLNDESIGAKVLERFGHIKGVGDTFFGGFFSGSWAGPTSEHWKQLASQLRALANQTKRAGVRRWAQAAANELDRMAERDRKHEDERRVRDYY